MVSLLVLWIPQAWKLTTHCPPNSAHTLLGYATLHVINILWESSSALTLTCEPSPPPLYTFNISPVTGRHLVRAVSGF